MEVMKVKRNGSTITLIFLILFLLFFLLVPTRFQPVGRENVTIQEEYTTTEEVSKLVPQETIQLMTEPISMEVEVRTSDTKRKIRDGMDYIEQDVVFITPQPYDGCFYFNYTLFRDDDKVNKERKETCFENQQSEITLTELYTGDVDDYYYVLNVPTIEVISEVEKTVIENVEVVEYEEVTKVRNITKEIDSEEVVRVNWITGYRWWFLN